MRRSLLLALATAGAAALTVGLLASVGQRGMRSAASRGGRVAPDRTRPTPTSSRSRGHAGSPTRG